MQNDAVPTGLENRSNADPAIVYALAQVRWMHRLKGHLPAFRRGKIYWDFRSGKSGKVRIGAVNA